MVYFTNFVSIVDPEQAIFSLAQFGYDGLIGGGGKHIEAAVKHPSTATVAEIVDNAG